MSYFSVRHFHERVTEKRQLKVSYNWLRLILQEAEVVEKHPARGQCRHRHKRRRSSGCWSIWMPPPINGMPEWRCRTW